MGLFQPHERHRGCHGEIDMSSVSSAKTFDGGRIKTLDQADIRGKRVLMRADLNVPMQDGVVTDDTRIQRIIPTIRKLLDSGAVVVILSHWGRPKGERSADTSLKPVATKLEEVLGDRPVHFFNECVGEEVRRGLASLKPGDVAVLENLRYHEGEKKNDPAFARRLAQLGDLFVNDAFSSAHR